MVDELLSHPGFLGFTSRGVIALHADWPAYPQEHGWLLALCWLTSLPPNTEFERIDDIDQCVLLRARLGRGVPSDPFDERHYHVAIWHEDLLELADRELVSNVSPAAESEWCRRRREALPDDLFTPEGERIERPPLDTPDDDDERFAVFDGPLVVTPRGAALIREKLAAAPGTFTALGPRVLDLFEAGMLDTAVREACVHLEQRLRDISGSTAWGHRLVEESVQALRRARKLLESHARIMRGELRHCFKFIRNEVAHQTVEFDEVSCRAQLFRIAHARTWLESVAGAEK